MKNFIVLLVGLSLIIGFAIIYERVSYYEATVYESKAVIAQVQPAIIQSQNQLVINKAVANQLNVNSIINAINSLLPMGIVVYLIIKELLNNETLRAIYTHHTKQNRE